jgi:hypothetical protein
LRRLFLTVFLRGRSSRGLQKESAPKTVGSKLALTLISYSLFGLFAFFFARQSVFVLSVYLHGMTFAFIGMFVAASGGEVLFNKEEPDILLHRPVTPRALLWAKVGVLVQVSLWLAGAFNLVGLFVGVGARDGGWMFVPAHVLSTALQALFCTSFLVMIYQLCLRWFGRERLDGIMTTAQVLVAVAVVVGGQLVPQLVMRVNFAAGFGLQSWWLCLLPPAWFAALDDALAGQRSAASVMLGALAMAATAAVLWLAFRKLADNYEEGLQVLGETISTKARTRRSWLSGLSRLPLMRWWFKDPVSRASFVLTAAYLLRDRDVKLRVYPGIAPMMVMPLIFLVRGSGAFSGSGFAVAFTGAYLGVIPMLGVSLLQYSQQWQAADLFRAVPIPGPDRISAGVRRAVLCCMTLPMLLFFGALVWFFRRNASELALLLPGIIALPVQGLIANLGGKAVPLSLPPEEAKSAGRGLLMLAVMMASMALAGISAWAWSAGWFKILLLVEFLTMTALYFGLRASLSSSRWESAE